MTRHSRLSRDRRAVAAIEFVIILPFMLALLAGVVDLSLATITARRLTAAAADVATIASTMAVQSSNLNAVTGQQAWQATTAPFARFPNWRIGGTGASFSITLSSVSFTPSAGGYKASTDWSASNTSGTTVLRPCGTLPAVADNSASSMSSLPAGVFGPTSILVGDVSTQFVPMFSGVFTGPIQMLRSAYVSPRINNGVTLSAGGPAKQVICPKRDR